MRAADLIGQLADTNYLRKQTALFDEFRETGMSNKLGYNSVADLRANYPDFFWQSLVVSVTSAQDSDLLGAALCGVSKGLKPLGPRRASCFACHGIAPALCCSQLVHQLRRQRPTLDVQSRNGIARTCSLATWANQSRDDCTSPSFSMSETASLSL